MSEQMSHCNIQAHDYSQIEIVEFDADIQVTDYQQPLTGLSQAIKDYFFL